MDLSQKIFEEIKEQLKSNTIFGIKWLKIKYANLSGHGLYIRFNNQKDLGYFFNKEDGRSGYLIFKKLLKNYL